MVPLALDTNTYTGAQKLAKSGTEEVQQSHTRMAREFIVTELERPPLGSCVGRDRELVGIMPPDRC